MELRRAVENRLPPVLAPARYHRGPECLWPHACFDCRESWGLSKEAKAKCPDCGGEKQVITPRSPLAGCVTTISVGFHTSVSPPLFRGLERCTTLVRNNAVAWWSDCRIHPVRPSLSRSFSGRGAIIARMAVSRLARLLIRAAMLIRVGAIERRHGQLLWLVPARSFHSTFL